MARKYETLTDLAAAFKRGELAGYTLWLDNDCTGLRYTGPVPDGLSEDEGYAYRDRKTDEAREWYRGNGYGDLGEACDAAGIPNEWV